MVGAVALDDRCALQQKGEQKKPALVLFVCTGNTCRSPMAAALYNDMNRRCEVCSASANAPQAGDVLALSAGLYANAGDPITPEAVAALREAGVYPTFENDYPAHLARNVDDALMDRVDLVVGISARHAMELMLRYPEHAERITALPVDIEDPFGRGQEAYRRCLLQIRECLRMMQVGDRQ